MESRLIINDKTLGWLMAFIIVNNIIATTFKVEVLYYALFLLAFIYAISKSRITSINIGMLLLYSACIMSIIINNVPAFFKSWERMASFVLVTIAISPCINSVCLNRIRIRLFKYSQLLMQIVVIFSFIFYLLGINLSGRKDFSGITWQSMLIAPISANVIITTIYYLTRDKKIKNKFKYYLFLLIISAFLSLLLAASRTALIGTCAAVLLYLFMVYYNRIKTLLKVCFSIIIIMTLSFSYWSPFLDNVQNKNKGSISAGGITSSRDEHWQKRIKEFKSSPFFGVGFATVSVEESGSTFNKADGKVETGSSWLNILSMTGIFGFICFISLWINNFFLLIRLYRYNIYYSSYLSALLIFWCLHMIAEGYIFAAGGFLFFCVWLLLGYIYILGKYPHYLLTVR